MQLRMRFFKPTFIISILIFLICSSRPVLGASFDVAMRAEPSLNLILKTYLKQQGLEGAELERMLKRARIAPVLPTLYMGVDVALRENSGLSVTDNISVSSGIVTVGPDDNNLDYDNYSAHTFRVRAVWRLDELVFNRNEWIYLNQKRDLARSRSDQATRLIKIYEQRLLHLAQYFTVQNTNLAKREFSYQKYQILTAELDALTRGEFKSKWWKR